MKISVALCTFNGVKFIREQLDSILHQSVKPDEIVISDDGSTDGTVDILKEYANSNKCIRLYLSQTPLGVIGNFSKCLSLCQGDYIFLCDQDDIWQLNKVSQIVNTFEKQVNTFVIFTNAEIIDENGRTLDKRLFGNDFEKSISTREDMLLKILKENFITGATMAIRKSLLSYAGEISPLWMHDEWLSVIAMLQGDVCYINEVLTLYRIHGNNQAGLFIPSGKNRMERFKKTVNDIENFRHKELLRIQDIEKQVKRVMTCKSTIIECRQDFLNKEYEFLSVSFREKILIIIYNLKKGYYSKYSSGLNAVFKDLFILFSH